MKQKTTSWKVIYLFFFIYPPIGIYLLVRKLIAQKRNYTAAGNILKTIGISIMCIFTLALFTAFLEGNLADEPAIAVCVLVFLIAAFIIGGGFLTAKGQDYIKRGKRYERYKSIVTISGNGSIDAIASAFPASYEAALKDLEKMIDGGYFENCYIDYGARTLVMPGLGGTRYDPQPVAIRCSYCGAEGHAVPGKGMVCEYCGKELK